MGKNVNNNLEFGRKLKKQPIVFGVNYFLREVANGKYLNTPQDKHVWIKWMELRVHNEADAIKTPTGYIPKYADLKKLFKSVLNKEYSKEDYIKQFTIRVPENLAKIERVSRFYQENVSDTPSGNVRYALHATPTPTRCPSKIRRLHLPRMLRKRNKHLKWRKATSFFPF